MVDYDHGFGSFWHFLAQITPVFSQTGAGSTVSLKIRISVFKDLSL
jgi:hypothetical protein